MVSTCMQRLLEGDARQKASAYACDPLPAIVERDHLWPTSVQKGQLKGGEQH